MQNRFIVIGAGVAGTSAAAFLAEHGPTVLLEAEDHPGYHATGRSVATYIDTYGHPIVCAVTRASRGFFWSPPAGFADVALVRPSAELRYRPTQQADALAQMLDEHGRVMRPVAAEEMRRLCPILRPEIAWSGAVNTATADIDVDALLQGYLRLARARGPVVTGARVTAVERTVGGWRLTTSAAVFEAAVVVNAASGLGR